MASQEGTVPFSIPFRAKIMNALCYGKVKMPTMDLYDETMDLYDETIAPKEHQGVYKAQIYVQNIDDVAYCRYFLTTLKTIV